MRLLFVVESGTDVRLVDGLAERNEVVVFARRIRCGREISQALTTPSQVIAGPASRFLFAAAAAALVLRRRRSYDHVLTQGFGVASVLVNAAARLGGLPATMLVCSPTQAYFRLRRDGVLAWGALRALGAAALGLAGRLNSVLGRQYVVLSPHLARVVAASGTRRPVHVVPIYGVDTDRFVPAGVPRQVVRERLGLPAGGALLFFSSRVAPEKDASTLLEALARLCAEGRDVRLLHRSGGFREFAALAQRHGVGDRVIASDAVHPEDLPASYQASDMCVQASRAEGLGFSVLEALACEVPVVAAAVGGLLDTIMPGETGWTYPVGDAGALACAIAAALDDPAEARRRAAAGRRMVGEKYERRAVFASMQEVLEPPKRTAATR